MLSTHTIQHLSNKQIDRQRWNNAIDAACNGSPYVVSEYLDTLCPTWEALILDNYEWVMPLPVRSKYGIRYLYQPFLVPQLGVFGPSIDIQVVETFLRAIPTDIRWIDLRINKKTYLSRGSFEASERSNFVLDLSSDYATLRSNYRSNHIRNLQRAEKAGCSIERNLPPEEVYILAETYLMPSGHFTNLFKQPLLELFKRWMQEGRAITYGIKSGGLLLASAVFLIYKSKAYYILVGNHPNGKTLGASHALIDAFIRDHAGKQWILDFEGSNIPSLAFFYEGFGSRKEPFGWIQENRLPAWMCGVKSMLSWIEGIRRR